MVRASFRRIAFVPCSVTMVIASLAMTPAGPPPQADTLAQGRSLFNAHCARCHGEDGAKRKWGATDLRFSVMETALAQKQVRQGKGIMPSFERKLTETEIDAVVRYVRTLRVKS
jgi:mono/diheme cytochrome c family protein